MIETLEAKGAPRKNKPAQPTSAEKAHIDVMINMYNEMLKQRKAQKDKELEKRRERYRKNKMDKLIDDMLKS